MSAKEDPAVTNFREYIRCKTVHPDPDYGSCTEFLRRQGKELGAEVNIYEKFPGNPVVILTLPGTDPSLPTVLLNSHTDVVPVYPEHWKYDPFSAHKDENGDIYGRGTQDMKCVGIQYMEALKRLKKEGRGSFLRTIHLSFVPDEEVGGVRGMEWFVDSDEFRAMNVGCAMDEGYANPGEECFIFYGDRSPWNMWVHCPGQPGHGSQFLPNTAGEKLQYVVNKFLAFRDAEEQRLKADPKLSLGDVVTLNLTMLKGGVQFNVVPAQLSVGFNIRVPPTRDFDQLEKEIRGWCREAGEGITLEFEQQTRIWQTTCVEDGKSPWWDAFAAACKKENIKLIKQIFPAATDSRLLRQHGIPAIGFSPMNHTPLLLHDHNEFLNERVFLRGIEIYTTIIPGLANLKLKECFASSDVTQQLWGSNRLASALHYHGVTL